MARMYRLIAGLPLLLSALPAAAQDSPATEDGRRIVFDLSAPTIDAEEDWGIEAFRAANPRPTPLPTCQTDSDIIQAQSRGPQRYDDNGAVIRSGGANCALDSQRDVQTVTAQPSGRPAVLREPECEESAAGYACSSSGRLGSGRFARESRCEETSTERSCSSSFSFGTSEDGRNRAQEEIERMRQD